MTDLRHRFPGLGDGWARFDGPAGTQVVDTAIEATSSWQRSGNNANSHGPFAAAEACDELVSRARSTMGELLGADGDGIMFGPSTTANVFSITRAIARDLGPGDEIVCTRIDHDSNISPWLLAAADTGATVRLVDFDVETGRLPTESVAAALTENTRWVAVTGASNAIGTMPDVAAITAAAKAAGAMVMVDGVHLTPHARVDVGAIGCDVYSTSSYKWYGPHAGITWLDPGLLADLVPYKVRPADDDGPDRLQLGTPSFESIAGLDAAARFLLDEGMEAIASYERRVFERLLAGLVEMPNVRVLGPHDCIDRAPTLAFRVDGMAPSATARALAAAEIAVWDGDYYAMELMASYGLADGAVRAGITRYIVDEDIDRLLTAVAAL
ncbi:MAG: cysteine desulfurase-like protein [Acidimicrobiia bacterium]|nr:cysteine desulfurase-like protein [Acidimicrobiia bacterium]